jgi:signal transduction histidine kinase
VQLDTRLQRRLRGTGLGLSLSRKLAEMLGGRVGVESEPGVGSRFWVIIPVAYHGPPGKIPA